MYRPKHFGLKELACPHIYAKFGDMCWQFFDIRLLETIDFVRDKLGPMYVNNWDIDGAFDERGFRCIQCSLVKSAIKDNRLYVSPHMLGKAVDFDILGMTAQEVREWLIANQGYLPYNIRLEDNVNWVHLDVEDTGKKIQLFQP